MLMLMLIGREITKQKRREEQLNELTIKGPLSFKSEKH
jgi:hypothetical protein